MTDRTDVDGVVADRASEAGRPESPTIEGTAAASGTTATLETPTEKPAVAEKPAVKDDLVERTLSFFSSATIEVAGSGDELVVRRVILARKRWDELVEIAEVLRNRNIPTNPSEIAAIVIEAGLVKIREIAVGTPPKVVAPKRPPAAKRPSATTSAPAPAPLALSEKDQQELARITRGRTSQRSVQRALGLWLGFRAADHDVGTEPLRELCRRHGVYNIANFAQNMKKDAACFDELRGPGGERHGWRLTAEGLKRARSLLGEEAVAATGAPGAPAAS